MLVKLIYLDDNLEPVNTYWLKASNVFYNQVTGLLDIRDRQLDSQSIINININHTPVILYINGVLEIGQPKTDLETPPKQAQKQEKLLGLYRKIYHISPMKNETKESYWARVEYLDNKIKELENEQR